MEIQLYESDVITLFLDTNAAPQEIFVHWSTSDADMAFIEESDEQARTQITVTGNCLGYPTITCTVVIGAGEEPLHTQPFEVPLQICEIGM